MSNNNKVIFCKLCFETNLRPNSSFNNKNVCIACQFSKKDVNYNYKYKLEYFDKLIKKKKLKSKKYNYISTIEPKRIKNISGTITNLNNTTIVSDNTGRIVFNFIIKPCL